VVHPPRVVFAPAPIPPPLTFASAFAHPSPLVPCASVSSGHYDCVGLAVITLGRNGRRQILFAHYTAPTNEASAEVHRPVMGETPQSRLDRLVAEFGLTHFGKHTTIDHVDHTTRQRVLCRVVYAPQLSCGRINGAYSARHPHAKSLVRCYIGSHRRGSIETERHGILTLSDFSYNLVHAIDRLWRTFV
jgi:hypothetical protein